MGQTQISNKQYTLEMIREEKLQVRKQISESGARLKDSYQKLVAPPQQPATKMQTFMNIFDQGVIIYDGVMMGLRIARTVRSIFGSFGKRKKW